MWRYSMAALIVCAAMLDVVWWMPAHRDDRGADTARVQAELPQCRRARKQAELEQLEAELRVVQAKIERLDVEIANGE